jgi:hypothetical protein
MGRKIDFEDSTKIDKTTEFFNSNEKEKSKKNVDKSPKTIKTPKNKRLYIDLKEEEEKELDEYIEKLIDEIGVEIKKPALIKSMFLAEFKRRLNKK